MITKFKIFERLGIDDIVVRISDKVYEEFLKHYDTKKNFTDIEDRFNVNVLSENFSIDCKIISVIICYNKTQSRSGYLSIEIGILNRQDEKKVKSLDEIKEEILHEIEHNVFNLRKYGKIEKDIKIKDTKHRFLSASGVRALIEKDIIGSFNDPKGNTYKMKVSIINFLKYDKLTEQYKKLISYLYLSDQDEYAAKLHELYNKAKISKDFSEVVNDKKLNIYKDMINFKMNFNDFSEEEKKKIIKYLFKPQDIKKVERYINNKSQKFIRKIYKLSYFQNSEVQNIDNI